MSSPLLTMEGLEKRFLGVAAVKDVDLQVGEGEIVSIIGPNGAGKTTMFNLITGQLTPSKGRVHFAGQDITGLRSHDRARLGLGRTFQIVQPLESLTVLENVMVGTFLRHPRRRDCRQRACEVLERVELDAQADELASSLTLVGRKRLEVARALGTEPKILLLDEVMAGLNPTEAGEAVDLFRRLNEEGLTILLIEHNLKVVRAFSKHVVVLHHGELLAQGTAEDVLSDPAVIEAYIGGRTG